MASPHPVGQVRPQTQEKVIVTSAFVLVAIAIGALIYAYSSPGKQIQAANVPSLIQTTPAPASQ
jgi:hypothetical protein